jgi:hypothetical protein
MDGFTVRPCLMGRMLCSAGRDNCQATSTTYYYYCPGYFGLLG